MIEFLTMTSAVALLVLTTGRRLSRRRTIERRPGPR
jgi:hypothetical protein